MHCKTNFLVNLYWDNKYSDSDSESDSDSSCSSLDCEIQLPLKNGAQCWVDVTD